MFFVFFFFQAEDGIRDGHVTGVQTCALPISYRDELTTLDYQHPIFDRGRADRQESSATEYLCLLLRRQWGRTGNRDEEQGRDFSSHSSSLLLDVLDDLVLRSIRPAGTIASVPKRALNLSTARDSSRSREVSSRRSAIPSPAPAP